jgi:hypothetical protein
MDCPHCSDEARNSSILAQTPPKDLKVAYSSTVPAMVSSKFVGKYSLKQGREATDKSMLQEVQDQGDKAGR